MDADDVYVAEILTEVILDEMNEIIICKYCLTPEYYGEMRWLSGFCGCRSCYKAKWQDENQKPYTWDDLDGKRPTMKEYEEQEKEEHIYNS